MRNKTSKTKSKPYVEPFSPLVMAGLDKKIQSDIENKKKHYQGPPRKILVNISVVLLDPYAKGELIKTALPRILREFALIEESPEGAQNKVETYTDKFGNKLTSIVSIDYGFEIPYPVDEI